MCSVDLTTEHPLPDDDCILEKLRQDEATGSDAAVTQLNECQIDIFKHGIIHALSQAHTSGYDNGFEPARIAASK